MIPVRFQVETADGKIYRVMAQASDVMHEVDTQIPADTLEIFKREGTALTHVAVVEGWFQNSDAQ